MWCEWNVMCCVKRTLASNQQTWFPVGGSFATRWLCDLKRFIYAFYRFYRLQKGSSSLGGSSKPCYFTHWCVSIDSEVSNLLLLGIKSWHLQTVYSRSADKFSPVMSFSPTYLLKGFLKSVSCGHHTGKTSATATKNLSNDQFHYWRAYKTFSWLPLPQSFWISVFHKNIFCQHFANILSIFCQLGKILSVKILSSGHSLEKTVSLKYGPPSVNCWLDFP